VSNESGVVVLAHQCLTALPAANIMRADTHVQQLCLASVGMGAAGGEAIATMVFQ
jgi:hypothetical protein